MGIHTNQRGVAHLAIIVVVLVLAVAGGAYYMVKQNSGTSKVTSQLSEEAKVANAACVDAYGDEDFCAFVSNWSMSGESKMTLTNSEDGSVTTIETDKDGNTRMSSSQNGEESYAAITIGNSSYVKNVEANNWMKYTSEPDTPSTNPVPDFSDEIAIDPEVKPDTSTVTAEGKEACGNLTCFKYKVSDTTTPDEFATFWFDDKDYKLRKMETTSSEGTVVWTVEYEVAPITEPSPVVEMPTIDSNMSQEEIQQIMQSFGN